MSRQSTLLLAAAKNIGLDAWVTEEHGLKFRVKILNVSVSYGKVRYLVTPTDGAGQAKIQKNIYPIPSHEEIPKPIITAKKS